MQGHSRGYEYDIQLWNSSIGHFEWEAYPSKSCKLLSKTLYIVLHGLKFSRAFTMLFNILFLNCSPWPGNIFVLLILLLKEKLLK